MRESDTTKAEEKPDRRSRSYTADAQGNLVEMNREARRKSRAKRKSALRRRLRAQMRRRRLKGNARSTDVRLVSG